MSAQKIKASQGHTKIILTNTYFVFPTLLTKKQNKGNLPSSHPTPSHPPHPIHPIPSHPIPCISCRPITSRPMPCIPSHFKRILIKIKSFWIPSHPWPAPGLALKIDTFQRDLNEKSKLFGSPAVPGQPRFSKSMLSKRI